MIPDISLPFDILKPGIRTTPFCSQPAFPSRERGMSMTRCLVVAVPRYMGGDRSGFFVHFSVHQWAGLLLSFFET